MDVDGWKKPFHCADVVGIYDRPADDDVSPGRPRPSGSGGSVQAVGPGGAGAV